MSENTLKHISIDQLRIGVFVSKLDISWLDSPFIGKTRLINKQEEIDKLKASGAKKLVIDLSKGLDVLQSVQKKPIINEQTSNSSLVTPAPNVKQTSLNQEMEAAFQIRKQIKDTLENSLQLVAQGKVIDKEELLPLVDSTLESLQRNDQALMSLVHISRKTQKLTDHSFGTFCLILNLAISLDVSEEDREALGLAALFHETGWSSLPLNLLGKRNAYSKSEVSLISKHPLISEKILKDCTLPELTLRIISEHHELLDGTGYPRQLHGAQIHPLTQLFSVIDIYDERVHQLQDKPGMLPTNALTSLYRNAEQGKFDPKVVGAFINLLGIYPPTTPVLLNTGEKAIVKEVRRTSPLQPIVSIYYDKCGQAYVEPLVVDLLAKGRNILERSISEALDLHLPGSDPAKCLCVSEDTLN